MIGTVQCEITCEDCKTYLRKYVYIPHKQAAINSHLLMTH